MVRARLHLICGICGSGDDWDDYNVKKNPENEEPKNKHSVSIGCGNCATLHFLDDYMDEQN